jgi:hypothetical protein
VNHWQAEADRLAAAEDNRTRCYGVNVSELKRLHAAIDKSERNRGTMTDQLRRARARLKKEPTCTARSLSRDIQVRLSDARQVIARLKDVGELRRDGTRWEPVPGDQQGRESALYRYVP